MASAFDCSIFENQDKLDCDYLNTFNESLIANLLYSGDFYPNHDFVKSYNGHITPIKPDDVDYVSGGFVKHSWMSILHLEPSVVYNQTTYVDNLFTIYSDYDYSIEIPSTYYNDKKKRGRTCRIYYSLYAVEPTFTYSLGNIRTNSKVATFGISSSTTIQAKLQIRVVVQNRVYEWVYRNRRWRCYYDYTTYSYSSTNLYDSISVSPYNPTNSEFTIINSYYGTIKGDLNNTKNNIYLSFDDASYSEQKVQYSAIFTKSPNNFIQIVADDVSKNSLDRINKGNTTFTTYDSNSCNLQETTFFETTTKPCINKIEEYKPEPFKQTKFSNKWKLLGVLLVIGFIVYLSFKFIKKTWGKIIPVFLVLLLSLPFVSASECGLNNLGACIPESLFDYFSDMINAPIQPLISASRHLMEEPIVIAPFFDVWQVILYVMGFFYLLMFAFVGFTFLTSGHDIAKRELAKEWLKNTFLVIIFTSASFYFYELILEVSSVLTSSFLQTVPEEFFLLTIDNISNVALQFFSNMSYLVVLGFTVLILGIRYIITAIGVIFIPIGLFCYFVPPLKSYGNLILQLLGISIFIPVINALIIIACSKILEIAFFSNIKILVMISCFSIIDVVMGLLIWHVITKTGVVNAGKSVIATGKYIAALFI